MEGLEYRFGKRSALAGIDLRLHNGEILGLVGPNGSGKTTLLKVLAGLLRPARGIVRVLGLDPFDGRAEVMERARFAFAPPPLIEELSAFENLHYVGGLGGASPSRQVVEEALEVVGLAERSRDRVRSFSMGMKQRLTLALALVPRPELLILDEPTDGLDPLAVLELRGVLTRLREEHGVTILLSSHLMVEVEQLVDRVLVLMEGRVEFCGSPNDLLRDGERLLITLERGELEALARRLRSAGHDQIVVEGERLVLPPSQLDLEEARRLAHEADCVLRSFHVEQPHLEAALLERQRRRQSSGRAES